MSYQSTLNVAIPAITFFLMLLVGMDLNAGDFTKVRRSPRSFFVGLIAQYLLPFAALATLTVVKPAPAIAGGMILIATSPGGGISNYYTYLARANVALSVVLTTISCLFAALTMPLMLGLFESVLSRRSEFQVPLKILFGQLLLLLVLPVSLGIWIRRTRPLFVVNYDRFLRGAGVIGLAILISFILQQTADLFFEQWKQIGISAAVFIFLSMTLGYLLSLSFRLNGSDIITIVIECAVRNLAIATTAAVVILRRTEFATFSVTYFLVETILILMSIAIFRQRYKTS